jgi:hypothetical protein
VNETRPISVNVTINQTSIRQEFNDSSSDDDNEIRPPRSPTKILEDKTTEPVVEKRNTRGNNSKVVVNPWVPLDPHVEDDSISKMSFKKKKTMRIPKMIKNMDMEVSVFPKFNSFALGKLYNDEFASILKDANKHKKKKSKKVTVVEEERHQEDPIQTIRNELGQATDSVVFHDIGGVESDNEIDFGVEGEAPLSKEISNTLNDHNLSEFVQTYEDYCKENLETYLTVTSSSNQEGLLLRRVQEWTNAIEPKLEQESQRKPYDIEEYGDSVLKNITGDATTFDDVVGSESPEEVCRIFLATLQLANWNNITIDTTGDFVIKKLNSKTVKRVETFRAPSIKKVQNNKQVTPEVHV